MTILPLKDISKISMQKTEQPADPALKKEAPVYWIIVAMDYDGERAFIMDQSEDMFNHDWDLNHEVTDDRTVGGTQPWDKSLDPGLYKLDLRGWSHRDSFTGEYDVGLDVTKVTQLVKFPPRIEETK